MIAFPLIMAVYAGVADGARETALKLAAKKTDTASLIGVGALENAYVTMNLAIDAMLAAGATATPSPELTSRVMVLRTLVGKAAIDVGEKAIDVAGGAGFYRAAGLEQRFRDLQAARYHPLQERPQQILAARTVLGLDIDG
jgi:acyl-CoA dehydrogenase